jgi:polysaccharide biosynthesis transport protein
MKAPYEPRNAHLIKVDRSIDAEVSRAISFDAGGDYSEEPTLRDYLRSLRNHWLTALGLPALCTMLFALYLIKQPNIYQADVRIQVDSEQLSDLSSAQGEGVRPVDDYAYFNTQLAIIDSPTVLRRVVKTLDLEKNQAFRDYFLNQPSIIGTLKENLGLTVAPNSALTGESSDPYLSEATREELVEAQRLAPFVQALQRAVEVTPVIESKVTRKDTRLIEIGFAHPDPHLAADIVNTLANEVLHTNLKKISETGIAKGEFLQRRIGELKAQVRSDEESLAEYSRSHQILSLDDDRNTVVERLVGLTKQLLEAENERKEAEAAFRAALAPGAAEALSDAKAKEIESAELKLNDLRQRRGPLLIGATEKWPEVQEIDKQIEILEKQINDARGKATNLLLTNLETRYHGTLDREKAVRADFEKQRNETLTQNQAAVNYRMIQQEIDTNRKLLNGLLQRYKENEVSVAGTQNNISIADYAVPPDRPTGPPRLLYLGIAFALFLPLGVSSAILRDYLSTNIRSADDVERWLNLPALAAIPSVKGPRRNHFPYRMGVSKLLSKDISSNPELLFNAGARSQLAESFRQLRTPILLSALGDALKTILVTSSQAAEGKTTTAVNLGISLAQQGVKVLVIDADMRNSRLHVIFDLDNERGLSTILSGEEIQGDMATLIKHHDPSGVSVLTAGPEPLNPAELLGSERMRTLLSKAEAMFTHIIIDSPPVVALSDSAIISTIADGVLFVIRDNTVPREVARQSLKLLNLVGARVIGVVLNDVYDSRALTSLEYRAKYLTE